MKDSGEPATRDQRSIPASYYKRVIVLLTAFCCLSLGVAIGAIAEGVVGANHGDTLLAISHSPATFDALSAAFARAAETAGPSVVTIRVVENALLAREVDGSGLVVSESGAIVTSRHLIQRGWEIKVRLANGDEYDAKVMGQDTGTDIAILSIEARQQLVAARMGDSDRLRVGDWVLAIGSPFGLEQTVTAGIISAKDRVTDAGIQSPFQQFLQTDTAINPGNSGGPLVNLAGEVIGINTMIATSNGLNNGIGLALPSSTVVDVYNQIVTSGRVRRASLGIELKEMTEQVAGTNNISDSSGVVVRDLSSPAGPAARAGLQRGDIITSVEGQKVKSVRDLVRLVGSLPVGSTAAIGYLRNGAPGTVTVVLEERAEDGR